MERRPGVKGLIKNICHMRYAVHAEGSRGGWDAMDRYDRSRARIALIVTCAIALLAPGCSKKPEKTESYVDSAVHTRESVPVEEGDTIPVTYQALAGKWGLHYSGNYGYDFFLAANYRAIVILYLHTQAIVFKGVMALEDPETLRINIVEMKSEPRVTGINHNWGFSKAKSSYFLFKVRLLDKNKSRTLELRPARIIIDGNDSEGYFEPIIKLKRI